MASEAAVIARQSSTLSIVGTVKDALVFCDEQNRKPDLCEEMRKATQMIRAPWRGHASRATCCGYNLNIAISRMGAAARRPFSFVAHGAPAGPDAAATEARVEDARERA
jgi:hypothetical protein